MWLEAYTVSSLTRGSMQTYRRRRSLNQSKRVFPVFVRINQLSRVRVWLSCAWLSHSWRKVVRLFQKWYDFLESGTTFLCISHSRRRHSLSRHSLSLKRHGVRLSRAYACSARAEGFSKKCLHVSQSQCTKAFPAIRPFTFPSFPVTGASVYAN